MARLRIGNKEDIKKVIKYEHKRGYNRTEGTQQELKEYTIEYTALVRGSTVVQACNEEMACHIAEREFNEGIAWEFDDFEVYSIEEEEI